MDQPGVKRGEHIQKEKVPLKPAFSAAPSAPVPRAPWQPRPVHAPLVGLSHCPHRTSRTQQAHTLLQSGQARGLHALAEF